MVKIRLNRTGVRNHPFYRIVAVDEREKKGGVPLQVLGYWQPSKKLIKIDKKALEAWVSKGALVSPAVSKLI
ncbi:MAG: 30S ribosomal protein S16 [Candidatus Microgenomates bacterium]|jgi:small subunit ribosomal protein S16